MRWFNDLRLSAKLLSSFVFVAVMAAVVGAVGIRSIHAIEQADTRLYERMQVPTAHLGAMIRNFQGVRINLRDLADAETPAARTDAETRVREQVAALDSLQTLYVASIASPEMQAAYDRYAALRGSYGEHRDRAIALSLAGRGDEAKTVLAGDAKQIARDVIASMDSMAALKVRHAGALAAENSALAGKATRTMLLLVAGAVALAVGLGVLLARLIGRPVAGMAAVAQRLAQGDVDQRVEHASRDEVGSLAESFRGMIGYLRDVAGAADALARGDLSVRVAPRSDRDVLSRAVAGTTASLTNVLHETSALIDAARDGRLDVRGDAQRFPGGFRELVGGVNGLLDAVVVPMRENNAVLERVAAGDLTARVTGEYRGDFLRNKEAMNRTIESMRDTLTRIRSA
ncbi:MCP four helix bundle domain-containing protein, partial [Longimicrobium sp.]|uniref:MCP four helix bundle domain-containing protein n=1 Tax=Longimicrobium sp. TaxID=2029185 RepID=UPI002E363DF9